LPSGSSQTRLSTIRTRSAEWALRRKFQRRKSAGTADWARILFSVSIPARAEVARSARECGGGVIVVAVRTGRARSAGRTTGSRVVFAKRADRGRSGSSDAEVTRGAEITGDVIGGVRNRSANQSTAGTVVALSAIASCRGHASARAILTSRAGRALSCGGETSGNRISTDRARGAVIDTTSGTVLASRARGGCRGGLSLARETIKPRIAEASGGSKARGSAIRTRSAKRALRRKFQGGESADATSGARILFSVSIPARAEVARSTREGSPGVIVVAVRTGRARSAGRTASVRIIFTNRADGWGGRACGAEVASRTEITSDVIGGVRNRCANQSAARAVVALSAIAGGGGHTSACTILTSRARGAFGGRGKENGSRIGTLGARSTGGGTTSGAIFAGWAGICTRRSLSLCDRAIETGIAEASGGSKASRGTIRTDRALRAFSFKLSRRKVAIPTSGARILFSKCIPARAEVARSARESGGGVIVVAI